MKKALGLFSFAALTGLGAMLLFGVDGNAYIDPSVMTYMIQAIAGVVIAVGAGLGVYFRRARRKLNEKLNIEENQNKEVESDDIVVTDGEKAD